MDKINSTPMTDQDLQTAGTILNLIKLGHNSPALITRAARLDIVVVCLLLDQLVELDLAMRLDGSYYLTKAGWMSARLVQFVEPLDDSGRRFGRAQLKV